MPINFVKIRSGVLSKEAKTALVKAINSARGMRADCF